MKMFRNVGIRTKVILPLAVLAAVVSTAGIVLINHYEDREQWRHIRERGRAIIHAITYIAETTDDEEYLQRFVASMSGEPGVEAIAVISGNPRRIVASSQIAWRGQSPDVLHTRGSKTSLLLEATNGTPVGLMSIHNGPSSVYVAPLSTQINQRDPLRRARGSVFVRLDETAMRHEQRDEALFLALGLLGTMMWVSVAVYAILARVVLGPIERIGQVTRHTIAGQRKMRVESSSNDELGQLGRLIDVMLAELVASEKDARDASHEALEAKEIAERALAASRDHQFAIDQHAIVAVTDAKSTITYVNDKFCDISGHRREDLIGKTHRVVNSGHHSRKFWKKMWKTISKGEVWSAEVCNRAKNGTLYWVDTTIVPFKDREGRVERFVAIRADITSLKTVQAQLSIAARMDRLTDLPNRSVLIERLEESVIRARDSANFRYAVMFLDFDRFKLVNDSLGHDVGDALLVQIANRLRGQIRFSTGSNAGTPRHVVSRLGGDEFVILLDGIADVDDATFVAQMLLDVLSTPYQLGTHEVYSTVSMGIVFGDRTYDRAEDVLRDADTAMYEAKRAGKGRYVVFDGSMLKRVRRRVRLENDLHRALDNNELFLVYQPIVSLATGRIKCVEALIRWNHPTQGLIGPAEFIPIAEESALSVSIGQWVLEEGCRRLVEWKSEWRRFSPAGISINLSRRQFASPHLAENIRAVIDETGIDATDLQLEITEDVFVMDEDAAVATMQELKALGTKIAIDDFGTGTSSFASLHKFPVDTLKVDRSMITPIEESKDSAALIHALSVLVRNMGISMVAEGIESCGQVITLQELGCDCAQGYYFGKPMTAHELYRHVLAGLGDVQCASGAKAFAARWADQLSLETLDIDDLVDEP